ncbi:ATP-binding cassette domain-containing protein [Bdellovibrionota bacterium FG-1]
MNERSGLKVENLAKQMGSFILQADFEVGPGARIALVGPSGSGKTTLLRIIAGLEPLDGVADRGRIWLGDREIGGLPAAQRNIGFVFQDAALFDSLSVLENAAFGLRMRGKGEQERRAQTLPWLERVGLTQFADQRVTHLSGGERQRVALVRALVWKPDLLLLDEPFSSLDSDLKQSLRQEILQLHEAWPVPLLMVTHDEEDVRSLATGRLQLREESSNLRVVKESSPL